MASGNCYHHLDRPASGTCNSCGKGLCHECIDTLRTSDGLILCVDCYKKTLNENVAKVKKARKVIITELVMIVVGLIIGLIIGIVTQEGNSLGIIIAASIGGSFGTIAKNLILMKRLGWGWLWIILKSALWFIISPVVTLWRIIVRIKDIVRASRIARSDTEGAVLAEQFFKLARNPAARVENQKGEELDMDALLAQLGGQVQLAHDGSANLDAIINSTIGGGRAPNRG